MKEWLRNMLSWAIRLSLLSALLLSGCKKENQKSLPFETIGKGHSGVLNGQGLGYTIDFDKMNLFIAADEAEGQQLADTFTISPKTGSERVVPLRDLADIDYDQYFVIAAYLGVYGHSGAEITIEKLTQNGHIVDVMISAIEPKVGDRRAVQPIHFIAVKKAHLTTIGELRFNLVKDGNIILTKNHVIP